MQRNNCRFQSQHEVFVREGSVAVKSNLFIDICMYGQGIIKKVVKNEKFFTAPK